MKGKYDKYLLRIFALLVICIVFFVLFRYPQPGVADQGDFDRVMFVSRLKLTDKDINNPDFERFFRYPVADYKITAEERWLEKEFYTASAHVQNNVIIFRTSVAFVIIFISSICKMLGQDTFKTLYLAFFYSAVYIFSLCLIIKHINIRSKVIFTLFAFLCIIILLDGNYLVWFNSLYGEPMMITSLTLYIAAWLSYVHNNGAYSTGLKKFFKLLFVFLAAYLFIGSKMQVITSLPIIIIMLVMLLYDYFSGFRSYQILVFAILLLGLIIYPVMTNQYNKNQSEDTQYNSVFYGILKDSGDPRKDLLDLGLNPDLAVEEGKHSYMNETEYIKYVPHTELTQQEFYSKISNKKLVMFYITHPLRFFDGMKYTSHYAFITGTTLGKYKKSDYNGPVSEFKRFTLWSYIREAIFPARLGFIILVYITVLAVSVLVYNKNRKDSRTKAKIQIIWAVISIGLLQFPMPFVGNGYADTSKQLFLFNFTFDIILIASVCFMAFLAIRLWDGIKNKKAF